VKKILATVIALLNVLALGGCATPVVQPPPTTFFVTSVAMPYGANFGGLEGADRHCTELAEKSGLPAGAWAAYLSTQSKPGSPSINARDRIGNGPWHNARGDRIASNITELHGSQNNLNAKTALSERGDTIPGKSHDIITGTRLDGTAPSPLDPDQTCANWTNGDDHGAAIVGHHDRISAINEPWAHAWNSAHVSRGCSASKLRILGSSGLFYCFARQPVKGAP